MQHEHVVEDRGLDETRVRLEDECLDALVAKALVAAGKLFEVRDSGDLEPDEIVRVVSDALRVGFGEAHPNLGREVEAVHAGSLNGVRQRELSVLGETGNADSDEPQWPGAVAQSSIERSAGEVADPAGVGCAHLEGGRARADREVRIAKLRRDRACRLSTASEVLGEATGHPVELVVKSLWIADVSFEGLLVRDRDSLGRDLERAWIDSLGPVAHEPADLPWEDMPELLVVSPASSPIVSTPIVANRSAARGPTPGRTRIGNGARNRASPPGRTTVSPPGFRRSEATFATTFELATPSEHESRVRASTTA